MRAVLPLVSAAPLSRPFARTAAPPPLGAMSAASAVDLQSLATVLAHTLDANNATRAAAEAQLTALESQAGSHHLFLQLIMMDSVPIHVRQSASLRLKNLYHGYWSVRAGDDCRISETDRRLVRTHLLEAICKQTLPQLRVQLLEVLYFLWPSDTPNEWAELIPECMRNIQGGMVSSPPDLMRVYGSICALRMVLKRYQFRDPKARTPVYTIVDATFPMLLHLLQTMAALPAPTPESQEMVRIIVKIFFVSTTISIPPAMQADFPGKCQPWLEVLMFLLEQQLPGLESVGGKPGEAMQAAAPELIEKLRVTPGWKTKKWCGQALLRLHNRWGRPDHVGTSKKQDKAEKALLKSWATQFEQHCSVRVLGAFVNLLKLKTQGGFVTDRVSHLAFTFIVTCTGSTVFYKMLKPALPFLIQEAILQQLMLTAADLDLWKNDPQEFIRRSLDLMEEFQDPRLAATALLFELVQMRTRDTLQLTLNTITHVFETYEQASPAGRNYLQKEGAMRMFGSLKRLLLSKAEFKSGIENLLIRHVIPEFTSPHGFLRQRACWVIRKYSKLKWVNEEAHAMAVRSCVERLQDADLPVKMEAWESTSYIIEHEKVFEYIRPSLPLLMDQFFLLFQEIGNERVVGTLGTMVERFGNDVIPYAVKLVEKLAEMWLQLIQSALGPGLVMGGPQGDEPAFEPDEDDELTSAAYNCVQTINSVLYACESQPELYPHLLQICLPIMHRGVQEDCIESYEDILDMISVFTYFPAKIPDAMWAFLPRITNSFHNWASDFLSHMLPVFDNYLIKGAEQLCTAEGAPLLQAMFSIVEVILGDENRLIDATSACILIESMLANLRGRVDVMLKPVIQLCGARLLTIVEMETARAAARKKKAAAAAKLAAANAKSSKGGKIKKGAGKGKGRNNELSLEDQEEENEDEELLELKFALLDNLGVAAHYNPLLFSQLMNAFPPQFTGALFNTWMSYLESMQDNFDAGKNAVLGLGSLALLPLAAVPAQWRDAMPLVLNKLIALLGCMSTILAEQAPEDEAEEADDTVQFQDVDENQNVYHQDDDDADSEDADDASDEETGAFLDDMEKAMIGSPEGQTRFTSPLDEIDPFIFFTQAIETLSRQEPAFYAQWIASIGPAGQAALQKHVEQAKQHAAEMEAEKIKEAQEKAAAAAGAGAGAGAGQ